MLDADGQVVGFEGIVEDVTAQVRAEDNLRESELRYRQLIEALPHGVAIVQHDRIVFANPTIGRMLRLESPEQLIGKSGDFALAEEDRERVIPQIWRALENDGPWPLHFFSTSQRPDGTRFPSETFCSRITYGQERAVQFIIMDISERRASEAERLRLIEQLHQADKMSILGQLAAGVAHEINNPLTFVLPNVVEIQGRIDKALELIGLYQDGAPAGTVSGFVERHATPQALQEIPELLADCREGLERIQGVTRELKQFSRIEHDDAEPVDLVQVVESALHLVHNQLRYRARVICELEPLPPLVAIRGKLSQVLLNILLNAAQALQEGEPERHWVRVKTGREGDQIFVEIANNGAPIPEEQLGRIFDPFFTTKPREQGTGLGLTIAWTIIQQHGGRIDVSSHSADGTAFRIWLPTETGLSARPAQASLKPPESAPRSGRILVIDDEPAILRVIKRMLRDHTVVTATDGRQALELLREDTTGFDLIFCDLMMEELSGMGLYEKLKRDQPELTERMVFMTGGVFTSEADAFLDQVNNLRLEKPLRVRDLRDLVGRLLNGG